MGIAIRAEHVSKEYRLGVINHGMLYKDFQSWMARRLGRPDPHGKIGEDRFQTRDDQFWALKDVSFDIEEGDRVGIIGKNGAGKSTLLKILARITAPTEGKIKIKGRVASLLEVGTGFHGELTGRENIYLNGAILGMKKREIDRKLDEIIDFSGIEKHIDTPVKRYSSGMYVRLAFAVAAHLDSEILLADEVLAVGDAEFQKKAIGKMQDLSTGQGKTVLFVSHNLIAIKEFCNTGILLKDGRKIIQDVIVKVTDAYIPVSDVKLRYFTKLVAPKAEVLSIELCDEKGRPLNRIDTDTDIYFNIIYKINFPGRINMVLNISKDGAYVFQSINNHDNMYMKIKEIGNYRSVCCLPKQFLNNGNYILSMTIFEENYSNPKDFKDIYSFFVEDAISVRGDYYGGLLGCTRPLLKWYTETLEDNKNDC